MAGDWIQMRVDLAEDPAVVLMSDRLGMDEFAVVGRLHRVWSWASSHTKDGRANVTEKFIDKLLTHDGFAREMQAVGWLEITETSVVFIRWNRHNSKSAKRRALDARRKKRVRKMSASQPDKCPPPNRTKTGPEKRREEKSKGEERSTGEVSPDPSCSEPPSAASELAGEVVAYPVFEVVGGTRRWAVPDEMLAQLGEAYPGVDVRAEARKAWQWCRVNPTKRKTASGMPRFLNGWMERVQNSGGARAGPSNAKQTAGEHNRKSAATALEILDAARRRNANGEARGLLGFAGNSDGAGGDADVDRSP